LILFPHILEIQDSVACVTQCAGLADTPAEHNSTLVITDAVTQSVNAYIAAGLVEALLPLLQPKFDLARLEGTIHTYPSI
jgi:hypothetical protein